MPGLEVDLPTDAFWIRVGNRVIANDEQRSRFELAQVRSADGTWTSPTRVQVAPDGSTLAYALSDHLVIDQLSQGKRWFYRYDSPEEGFVWVLTPRFSADSSELVYTVVISEPLIWGLKRVDLSSGIEQISPLSDDAFRTPTTGFGSGSGAVAIRVNPGGDQIYAFNPIAWTTAGIYGEWFLPFTDAAIARGWLVDPTTWEMGQVVEGGGWLLPSFSGQRVAYTEGEAVFGPSDTLASALRAFDLNASQSKVLLQDKARLLIARAWSPDESRLAYLAMTDRGDIPPNIYGVLELTSLEVQEIDISALDADARVVDLAWLDDEHIAFLVRNMGKDAAALYLVNADRFSSGDLQMMGEFALANTPELARIVYVPGIGTPGR